MDPASIPVFQNLGLIPPPTDLHSGEPPAEISFGSFLAPVSPDIFRIGSICVPISSDIPAKLPSFRGELFDRGLWESIPDDTLYSILDGWQAGYDNDSVQQMVQISSVPTKDYIYKRLKLCSLCDRLGHVADCCNEFFYPPCGDVSVHGPCVSTRNKPNFHMPCKVGPDPLGHPCNACSAMDHMTRLCPGLRRCPFCHRLGHVARKPSYCHALPHLVWAQKSLPVTKSERILPRGELEASVFGNSMVVGMARVARDTRARWIWKQKQKIPRSSDVGMWLTPIA